MPPPGLEPTLLDKSKETIDVFVLTEEHSSLFPQYQCWGFFEFADLPQQLSLKNTNIDIGGKGEIVILEAFLRAITYEWFVS